MRAVNELHPELPRGCDALIDAYFHRIGGRPDFEPLEPGAAFEPDLQAESWEPAVSRIIGVDRLPSGLVIAYVAWEDGCVTAQDLAMVHAKCPRKVTAGVGPLTADV